MRILLLALIAFQCGGPHCGVKELSSYFLEREEVPVGHTLFRAPNSNLRGALRAVDQGTVRIA